MEMNLKNLLLVGVGTMAYALEKSSQVIEEMVQKGQLTVAQGKALNQELKNKFAPANQSAATAAVVQEVIRRINPATREDIARLEERLARLEKQLPEQ